MRKENPSFKLEGKQTDIIREFKYLGEQRVYEEKKITLDKQGNIIKEKVVNCIPMIKFNNYVFDLIRKGYI